MEDELPEDRILDDADRMVRVKRGKENIESEVWDAEMDLLGELIRKAYLLFVKKGFTEEQSFQLTMFFADTQIAPATSNSSLIFPPDDDDEM